MYQCVLYLEARKLSNGVIKIIKRIKKGDKEAFKELMDMYQEKFFRIGFSILKDYNLTLDAIQEAFIKVYKNIPKIDMSKNIHTFLVKIIVNTAIDIYRQNKTLYDGIIISQDDIDNYPIKSVNEEAGSSAEREEIKEKIKEVLEQLPQKFRLTLHLRDVEGFSIDDIAQIMETEPATVRWRLFKARKLFKERWENLVRLSNC